ncbi:unnamed protein product, partial [Musa hybrid cultivar]
LGQKLPFLQIYHLDNPLYKIDHNASSVLCLSQHLRFHSEAHHHTKNHQKHALELKLTH